VFGGTPGTPVGRLCYKGVPALKGLKYHDNSDSLGAEGRRGHIFLEEWDSSLPRYEKRGKSAGALR